MRRVFLLFVETLLLFTAGLLAVHLRFAEDFETEVYAKHGWMKLLLMVGIVQLMFYLFDLYDLPATRRYPRVLGNLVKAMSSSALLLAMLLYVTDIGFGRG